MRQRDTRGRFQAVKEDIEEGVSLAYRIIQLLPVLFLLFLLYRYFQLGDRTFSLLEESLCGRNCSCTCPLTPKAKMGL